MVKDLPAEMGDMGLIPDPGGSHMLRAKEKISFGDIAIELSEMKYRENTLKRYE